jgi:CIC family chloride channel protein
MVNAPIPHWLKMTAGGILTGLCGLVFLAIYRGPLIPIGPNYEAVPLILVSGYSSLKLVTFALFKLVATICSLAVGGVSAMFVPLFLSGGSFGVAFAQSVAHSPATHLYAAVGMAAFIAAAYKTPLTAVVFVAEATGGHPYIIPTLIGAAVAYAVSGEASVSGDQRLHEAVRVADLWNVAVRDVMQKQIISTRSDSTVREFVDHAAAHHLHAAYPVLDNGQPSGVIAMRSLGAVPSQEWLDKNVATLMERDVTRVSPDCNLTEAVRLLMAAKEQHMLLVTSPSGNLEGIVTHMDVLSALKLDSRNGAASNHRNGH